MIVHPIIFAVEMLKHCHILVHHKEYKTSHKRERERERRHLNCTVVQKQQDMLKINATYFIE